MNKTIRAAAQLIHAAVEQAEALGNPLTNPISYKFYGITGPTSFKKVVRQYVFSQPHDSIPSEVFREVIRTAYRWNSTRINRFLDRHRAIQRRPKRSHPPMSFLPHPNCVD